MVISTRDIYELCCLIAKQEGLNVTITESAKAGAITGGITFIMAACLGPAAIIPSAVAGGLLAKYVTNSYVPLHRILTEMSADDQEKLSLHVQLVIQQLEITDAVALIAIASQSNSQPYIQIVRSMGTYFNQEWPQSTIATD